MKHFVNIKSFEDLKEQFKKLARINHPDAGGDSEIMKEINTEYDQLFPVWKHRHNVTASTPTTETADAFRNKFYSQSGWEGSNHNWNRSLKEVAVIVRNYVKETYPTFKFSVRTSYASMCQELHVSLKEAPFELYKTIEQLSENDVDEIIRKANRNQEWKLNSWNREEAKAEIERIWNKCGEFYKVYRDDIDEMLKDVDRLVNSYNFEDCDGMTDYFHVDFYYFDCKPDYNFKIVEKAARIKKQTETSTESTEAKEIESMDDKYTYDIKEDTDTRDNSKIFVLKVVEKLDRDEYIKVNNYMKSIDGYYSKFKHGFIFKENPSELLKGNTNNNTQESNEKAQAKREQKQKEQKQDKKQSLIDKINRQIESIQKKIDSLSGDYKTNTWKRMNEQAGGDRKIENYQMDINTLQYLIDTLDNRDLTPLEENLIISSFRSEIYSYYVRHEAYLQKKGTALKEISYPEIDSTCAAWWNEEIPKKQNRLNKANIYSTSDLLKAVDEYETIHKKEISTLHLQKLQNSL